MARILVVDDDSLMRELLRIQLSKEGHAVHESSDPTQALRLLLQRDFDLVFTDINMPYMDGIELAQAIMGDPKTRHVPVIVLTGSADHETFQKARELGTRLLTKPAQGEALLREVRKALGLGKPLAH
jgi:two-component system chemotaxis response regulator CheY